MFLFYQCLQSPPRPSGEVWFLHSGIFWQRTRVPTYHEPVALKVAGPGLWGSRSPLKVSRWVEAGVGKRTRIAAQHPRGSPPPRLLAGLLPYVGAPPAPHLHAQPRHAAGRPPRHAGPGSCRAGGRVVRERRGRRPARGREEEEGRSPTERGKGGREGASSQPVAETHR